MDQPLSGFGAADVDQAAYVLRRNPCSVVLYELTGGIEREIATAIAWSRLAEAVALDWNARLSSKGLPLGTLPSDAGQVLLHRQFGRELDVLLKVVTSHQDADEMVGLWRQASATFRLRLWNELERHRADENLFAQAAQWLQEELRFRAPDGSEDPEREKRIWAARRSAMARINAERAKAPTWKAASRSRATWSR